MKLFLLLTRFIFFVKNRDKSKLHVEFPTPIIPLFGCAVFVKEKQFRICSVRIAKNIGQVSLSYSFTLFILKQLCMLLWYRMNDLISGGETSKLGKVGSTNEKNGFDVVILANSPSHPTRSFSSGALFWLENSKGNPKVLTVLTPSPRIQSRRSWTTWRITCSRGAATSSSKSSGLVEASWRRHQEADEPWNRRPLAAAGGGY